MGFCRGAIAVGKIGRQRIDLALVDVSTIPGLHLFDFSIPTGPVETRMLHDGRGGMAGGAVGLGYVTCQPNESPEDILNAEYTIEVEGVIEKATASLKPMYDPLNSKIRN